MFCEKCGAELKENAKFCGKCGAKFFVFETLNVGDKQVLEAQNIIIADIKRQYYNNLSKMIASIIAFILIPIIIIGTGYMMGDTDNVSQTTGTIIMIMMFMGLLSLPVLICIIGHYFGLFRADSKHLKLAENDFYAYNDLVKKETESKMQYELEKHNRKNKQTP